ncbi:MAG: hypothetical protein R8G66_22730 [Cytophagales bacterium]|nr:hypothetical protein [Cytophagales bacterium]
MATEGNDIKAIIRRPPHWMIRFGTIIMTLLIVGFLLISTKISVPDQIDIPVELDAQALADQPTFLASDSIPGHFSLPVNLSATPPSTGTVHLSDGFESFTYISTILSDKDGQAFVQVPRTFQSNQGQSVSTDCQIKITLEIPMEDITLYQKLVDALFGSFKI